MKPNGSPVFNYPHQLTWDVAMASPAIPRVEAFVPLENEENAWRSRVRIGIFVSGARVLGRYPIECC
jgi:hypothetical protein